MKKLLIITILSLFTFNLSYSNNQTDTIPSKPPESVLKQLPDSLNLTFKEVYSDIKEGLQGLGAALKVGSEHVYEVLIRQQYVYAISYSFLPLLFIIFILWFKSNYSKAKWYSGYRDTEDDWNKYATLTIVTGIMSLVFLIASIHNFHAIVTGFINPEYGAIKEIINFIK